MDISVDAATFENDGPAFVADTQVYFLHNSDRPIAATRGKSSRFSPSNRLLRHP